MVTVDWEAIEAVNAMAADVERHRKQRFLKRGFGKVLVHDGRPIARQMKRRLSTFMRKAGQRPDLDRQIASLYFQIDTALRGGRLDTVDKLLLRLSTRPTYKAEYLIAALTATLPAKSKLKYRQNLVWLTARILKHEGIDPHVILHGLA